MKFSQKQLQRIGELARDEFRAGTIEVDTTNLHDGSTVVMTGMGRRGDSRTATRKLEILVSSNGQSADLSTLGSMQLRRAS